MASATCSGGATGLTITAALTYLAVQSLAGWYLWTPESADKVTRQERAADQRFLAALVEEMQEGVVPVDRSGVVRTWSPGAERMFGWLAAETIGQPLADYLAAAIPLHDLETPAVGLPHTETRGPRKDGREIVCNAASTVLRDHEGRPVGVLLVFRDVTFEHAAQQALRRSEERYRSVVAAMTEGVAPTAPSTRAMRRQRGFSDSRRVRRSPAHRSSLAGGPSARTERRSRPTTIPRW